MLSHSFDSKHSDAYTRRAMEEKREEYEQYWARRTQVASVLTILSGAVLTYSIYFFANFSGIVAGVFGFIGARRRKSEFLLVALVLLIVEGVKNIGMIIVFVFGGRSPGKPTAMDHVQQILYFVEEIVILPYAWYAVFFLYRTLSADMIFQSEQFSSV